MYTEEMKGGNDRTGGAVVWAHGFARSAEKRCIEVVVCVYVRMDVGG